MNQERINELDKKIKYFSDFILSDIYLYIKQNKLEKKIGRIFIGIYYDGEMLEIGVDVKDKTIVHNILQQQGELAADNIFCYPQTKCFVINNIDEMKAFINSIAAYEQSLANNILTEIIIRIKNELELHYKNFEKIKVFYNWID